jgi:hypothetical protein
MQYTFHHQIEDMREAACSIRSPRIFFKSTGKVIDHCVVTSGIVASYRQYLVISLGEFFSFLFERTLSLIPKSFRTLANLDARLGPVCERAHSTMSSSIDSAFPCISRCTVTAMYARPLGEVHASVAKFRQPSSAFIF